MVGSRVKPWTPLAGGVDEYRGGAVDDVAGGNLAGAGLEDGGDHVAFCDGEAAVDAEDGTDVDVDVYVGGTVQGVEDDDVLALLDGAIEEDGAFVFLADEGSDGAAGAERVNDGLVGEDVQLLLLLALNVFCAEGSVGLAEAGGADFGFDALGGEGEAAHEPGEGDALF